MKLFNTKITTHILICLVGLVGSLFLLGNQAKAATISVPSDCSLADAIDSVNLVSDQGACNADVAPDGYGTNDTIIIEAGTHTLTGVLNTITVDVDITGVSASASIIDGGALYPGIVLAGVVGNFSNFTIQNTNDSGLNANGTATMNIESVISKNNAAAVGAGLVLDVGTVTINNSVFEGNVASAAGGGILNGGGNLTITNSAFINNSGGPAGGGLALAGGTNLLTNVTIAGNDADLAGGLVVYGGANVTLVNSTIYGNIANTTPVGGGIQIVSASGSLTLLNNLVAANVDSAGFSNCATDDSITPVSNGGNLSSDASCSIFNHASDLASTNPLVATITAVDNGGPTPTIALLAGSPARDAGMSSGAPGDDQRGESRPKGIGTDIGAFEADVVAAIVTTPSITPGAPNTGYGKTTIQLNSIVPIIGIANLSLVALYLYARRLRKIS